MPPISPSAPSAARVPFLDLHAGYRELRPEIDAAYARVMDSGWYIGGAEVEAFESEFAARCGADHCVAVASGLDALVLALRAMGVQAGDEVIVPAHTFVATWLAVSSVGAVPVPVDADPQTFNLDPALVERALTDATRAVIPVHLYGQPADTDALRAVCAARGVPLLEDAAQAHGAALHGRPTGSLGHAAAFSFYPGKNLGAFGDAGAIVTSDPGLAERARLLRNYGSARKYEHEVPGVNSRLDPLQAAFLSVKLDHLDGWNDRRRAVAARYLAEIDERPGVVELPRTIAGADPVWHLFVVRCERRDALAAHLRERGVETLIHYPVPPHLSGAYAQAGPWPALPVAERLADTVLSLPIGPHLDDAGVSRVIECVNAFE
jgi:dTDP-3-amino-3,4,6-trideoxy-alpha-D-glucose transaminase